MQQNVGETDRWVRIGLGSALAVAGALSLHRGKVAPVLLLGSSALLLESAITRVCPVNALLGRDTRSQDPDRFSRRFGARTPAGTRVGAAQLNRVSATPTATEH